MASKKLSVVPGNPVSPLKVILWPPNNSALATPMLSFVMLIGNFIWSIVKDIEEISIRKVRETIKIFNLFTILIFTRTRKRKDTGKLLVFNRNVFDSFLLITISYLRGGFTTKPPFGYKYVSKNNESNLHSSCCWIMNILFCFFPRRTRT